MRSPGCVLAHEIGLGRWQVGSQGSPWESWGCRGIIPVSPWSALSGRASTLWSNSSEKSNEEAAEEVMENTQPFWLSWLSHVLETWHLPEPWPPLPCGWLTSHCWPWNHIPTGAGLVSAIIFSTHSIITERENAWKDHSPFPISYSPLSHWVASGLESPWLTFLKCTYLKHASLPLNFLLGKVGI